MSLFRRNRRTSKARMRFIEVFGFKPAPMGCGHLVRPHIERRFDELRREARRAESKEFTLEFDTSDERLLWKRPEELYDEHFGLAQASKEARELLEEAKELAEIFGYQPELSEEELPFPANAE